MSGKSMLLIPFLLLVSLSIAYRSNGQGLKTLDNDYGIGMFKLGTSYNSLAKDLRYYDTNKEGVEFYKYIMRDNKRIFGKQVQEIGLGFFGGKLYTVSVFFGSLEKPENLSLLNLLKDMYDIPEIKYPNNNERVWVASWETGKVYLQATEYSCDSKVRSCETEVFVYSKSIKRTIPAN
jgi:hypothetical protein